MSHKTLISGTAYEVVGGAQMIDGTKFQIGGGVKPSLMERPWSFLLLTGIMR